MTRLLGLFLALIATAALARGGSVIAAGGQWAAIQRGDRCDAESRTVATLNGQKLVGVAGFAFTADRRHWGEFHVALSREPRPGASVIAFAGGQSFLLAASGRTAWARGVQQDQAILAAIRASDMLRVESRDRSGRRFSDRFGLAFAPTAIDAAAARCAGAQSGH